MLFATPIVREQLKLDPRFSETDITSENVATVAMERRGMRDLELMRHVNSILKEMGSNAIALRLYNGSGERLWLDREHYNRQAGIWKYPPDLFLDPGQWSVIVSKGSKPNGFNWILGDFSIAYRGADSNVAVAWGLEKNGLTHLSFPAADGSAQSLPLSAAKGGQVATVHRGLLGDNIVVDGIFTTKAQFPSPLVTL